MKIDSWPQDMPYNKLPVTVGSIGGNTISLKLGPLPFEIPADDAEELAHQLEIAAHESRKNP